ncbi:MAG: metallophosphoesterase, partial [Lachnospiraceae bacterium]|nr:metallophosphoesterase [Candidatus Equihabitans merdae]
AMYIAAVLPKGKVEKFFRIVGYYWYGVSVYIIIIFLTAMLIRLIVLHTSLGQADILSDKRFLPIVGLVCVVTMAVICIGGHFQAKRLQTTNYEVTINKSCDLDELNLVLVADQHLGYNIGVEMMTQMVEKINTCQPDLVVVAGDIFDNCFENIEEPEIIAEILKGIQSKYGVYAVLGNHDCEEEIIAGFTFNYDEKKEADEDMYNFIEQAGFKLLCDQSVMIEDSAYLFVRPDEERPGKYVEGERLTPDELMATMDASKPVIVFEHEPKFLDQLSEAGVDLHLAGHTHDGQLFPLNLTSKLVWKNSCGLLEVGDMTSIVTSGVGLYGPYIRVGTTPEVCDIHISFNNRAG